MLDLTELAVKADALEVHATHPGGLATAEVLCVIIFMRYMYIESSNYY